MTGRHVFYEPILYIRKSRVPIERICHSETGSARLALLVLHLLFEISGEC